MTKEINSSAVPVSKYAAKKAARAKANSVSNNEEQQQVSTTIEETKDDNSLANTTANKNKKKKDSVPAVANNFPEHIVQIALLIKNNAEIRRFTALGILNYLLQKGEISGEKRYVSFKWNKFAVKCDGLMREYFYSEPFFLNALVAAFSSFSASAQRTIDAFCRKEMSVGINKAVDKEEVNNIAALNEQYQENGNEVEQ